MDNKDLIIIALLCLAIYLYYQNQKLRKLPTERIFVGTDNSTSQTLFEINDEEEKEELIADKDEAIRKKNEAEAENLSLSNKLKLKQQEVSRKETEITRLKDEKSKVEIALNEKIKKAKEDLTSEKQQHKGSLERIVKLTEQITNLEKEQAELKKQVKKMPGSWDETEWPTLNSSKKEKK